MKAATARIEIQGFTAYSDGSGAPCTVKLAGFVFALDYLGGLRLSYVAGPSHAGRACSVAAERARKAYLAHLANNAPDGWFLANEAMYSAA